MELFAADGHDAGGCERVTGKSGMRPLERADLIDRVDVVIAEHEPLRARRLPPPFLVVRQGLAVDGDVAQADDGLALGHLFVPGLHHRRVGCGSRPERSSEDGARVLVPQVQVRPDPGRRVGFGPPRRADRLRPPDQGLGLPPVHHRACRRQQRLLQFVDVERVQPLGRRFCCHRLSRVFSTPGAGTFVA